GLFFFFQAEDGIRDFHVTGVQTCALPISEPGLRMHPDDAARRGLKAGELVRVASKRGQLVLPLELSDEVASGTVFAAMHWSGQSPSSGGTNEVCQPAGDARSLQPELKHAAVRVEPAQFGWHLLAARRGDALALREAVQPLLRECGYAGLSLLPCAANAADGQAWVLLRAAKDEAMPAGWMERLEAALSLGAGVDTLEYRDPRRGQLKRVAWRDADAGALIDGLLWADTTPGGDALLRTALDDRPWTGPRLAAFSAVAAVARDPVVCVCRDVTESRIRAAVREG